MSWNLSSRSIGFLRFVHLWGYLLNVFWSISNEPGGVDILLASLTPFLPPTFLFQLNVGSKLFPFLTSENKWIFNCTFLYWTKIQRSFAKAMFSGIPVFLGKVTIWCSLILSQGIWGILLLKRKKKTKLFQELGYEIFHFPCHWFEGRANLN